MDQKYFTEEELDKAFEEAWAKFPVFPVKEEHERHKIVSKSAFYAGVAHGLKLAGLE